MVVLVVKTYLKAHIRKGWLWSRRNPVTVALLVAAGFTYGMLLDTRDDQQITQQIVERSPCTADPAGRECQVLRNQIERARPIKETCIPFRRVGYKCPIRTVRPATDDQTGPGDSTPSPEVADSAPPEPTVPAADGASEIPSPPSDPAPSPPIDGPDQPNPVDPPFVPAPTQPAPQPLIDLTPVTDPVCELTRPIAALC